MTEIFVSYAQEDRDFVQSLSSALKQRKRETWIDWEGIQPTDKWHQEIFRAIEHADAILFVISTHSATSKFCREELTHASNNNKRIIPIVREKVDADALPEFIRERQWIFFRECDDPGAALVSLITALDMDLEWVKSHTRLLTRAIEWDRHKRDYSFALRGSELRQAEALITSKQGREPRLLPLQTDYILSSRRDATRRFSFTIGAAFLGLTAVLVLGLSFWEKRRESAINLAANFREMGVAALGSNNPLAAEVLFARALNISNTPGARERLVEARARSPSLLWISPRLPKTTLLTISGDGEMFATASPLQVSVWSVSEKRIIRSLHSKIIYHDSRYAIFGPEHRLLALGAGSKIEIWDLRAASEIPSKVITTPRDISSLTFSADGTSLITGDESGLLLIWSMQRDVQAPIREYKGHSDKITSLAIGSDQHVLISGSWDETAKVWDLGDGTNKATFAGHDDALLCVAISPDGRLAASAGWDDTIWIWDRFTGKPVHSLSGHRGSILSLAFSPDGKWLASGSEDQTARLWNVERGIHALTLPGHSDGVLAVAFVELGGRYELLSSDPSGVVRLWDISKIGQRDELITLRGHEGAVTMVAFSPTNPVAATSSIDNSIAIWDLDLGRLVKRLTGDRYNITAVAFSPDGKLLVSAHKTAGVDVWNIENGSFETFEGEDTTDKIRHIAFSHDGRLLVGGSDNGKIIVWNAKNGTRLKEFAGHTAKIQGLEFSPEGTVLASASEDSTVKLWRVSDWSWLRTFVGHRSGVYEIAFSPDGRLLLTASDDKTARLWRVDSGQEVGNPIQHESPVWAVDVSPDGSAIATGSEDSTVQLWDLAYSDGNAKIQNHTTLRLSDGPVWWLRFHRDSTGISLGITGQDRTLRIFNMSRFKKLFSNPKALEEEAQAQSGLIVAGTGEEPRIVTATTDRHEIEQLDSGAQASVGAQ